MAFKLFKKKSQFLGLDIGSQNTKMFMFQGNKPIADKMLIEPTPEGAIQGGEIKEEEVLSNFISQCVEKLGFETEFKVILNLSGKGVIVKKIDISPMDESMIPEFVEIEAEQELFYDKEEMELDYSVLKGLNFKQPDAPSLLVITVLKKTIESYNNLLRKTFMSCEIFDTSFTALFNSFEFNQSLDEKKKYMILDIGSRSTNLLVLIKNQIIFARALSCGGDLFSEGIQKNMGITYQEAEELKISTSKGQEAPEVVSSLILNKLNPAFCEEVVSCYELYHSLFPDQNLDEVYVTGGGSQSLGLKQALAEILDSPVSVFDPFKNINMASFKKSKQEYQPFFSVVTGLAMRSLT